jgi:hypothetical protein
MILLKEHQMHRMMMTSIVSIVALAAATLLAQGAELGSSYAQYSGTAQEQAACRPDYRRFCRHVGADQMRVLACLQDHRRQLSRACRSLLERNGQ